MSFHILAINPGSTSTKVGLFRDGEAEYTASVSHKPEELARYDSVMAQLPLRLEKVEEFLQAHQVAVGDLDAVVGRGGMLRPVESGTYVVDEYMLADLNSCRYGQHSSNLGAVIAARLAQPAGIPAYVVDPPVVDELADICRIAGLPFLPRRTSFHALNQKAVAKRFARENGLDYRRLRLIVVHLGGGISVGCHVDGRVIDVNNAIRGEGPFTPERAGALPAEDVVDLCFSGRYKKEDILRLLAGRGGLVAHLGTNDAREVERRISEGDKQAKLVYDAMLLQIARAVGAAAATLRGKVDRIIITGGIAHSHYVVEHLQQYIAFLGPITVMPGEDELQALAEGAWRVLSGQEQALVYGPGSGAAKGPASGQ